MPKRKAADTTKQQDRKTTKDQAENENKRKKIVYTQREIETRLKKIENAVSKNNNLNSLVQELLDDASSFSEQLSYVFVRIFRIIYTKRLNDVELIDIIKSKISMVQVDRFQECLDLLFKDLRLVNETHKIDKTIFDLCVNMLIHVRKYQIAEHLDTYLHNEINELLKLRFNEDFLFNLLDLFCYMSISEEQIVYFTDKLSNINGFLKNRQNLIEYLKKLFILIKSNDNLSSYIYKLIIDYFQSITKFDQAYVEQKSIYLQAERCAINEFTMLLKNDNFLASEFVNTIKILLDEYCKQYYLSRFLVGLILNLTQTMHKSYREPLMNVFVGTIERLVDVDDKCNKYQWIMTSINVKNKQIIKKLLNVCDSQRLHEVIDYVNVYNSLIHMSFRLIEMHGVSINMLIKPVDNKSNITCFATSILNELFRNCVESRKVIIEELMRNIQNIEYDTSVDNDGTVYVDQLEVLFKSKYHKTMFNKKNKKEFDDFHAFVMRDILAKCIFKLKSNLAFKLLNVFDSYLQINNKATKSLINLFKKSINDLNIEKRKICIYGLMICMRMHGSFKDRLFGEVAGDADQMSDDDLLKLFDVIRKRLAIEFDPDIKSYLYQAFCKLIGIKKTFILPILNVLCERIQNLLIVTSTEAFFKLDQCISNVQPKLLEPADVLLHCLHICYHKCKLKKQADVAKLTNDENSQVMRRLNQVETYFGLLTQTIVHNQSEYIYSKYRQQTEEKLFKTNESAPASSLRTLHQLQLGVIDALIEHHFTCHSFGNIIQLMEKYEQISYLVSVELENLMSPIVTQTPKMESGKMIPPASTTNTPGESSKKEKLLKRRRLFGESESVVSLVNKENASPTPTPATSTTTATPRSILRSILESPITPQAPQTPSKLSAIKVKNISFTNIKFDHTYRISYETLLDMLQTCLSDVVGGAKTYNDNLIHDLINLIDNELFLNYLYEIIENKLRLLNKTRNLQSTNIYDPQCSSSSEIFRFLSSLWQVFWCRVHSRVGDIRLFKREISKRFTTGYLNKIHRYFKYLHTIWNVVLRSYAEKSIHLFNTESTSANSSNQLIKDALKDCMTSFDNYNQEIGDNVPLAVKLCSTILIQIFDIIDRHDIDTNTSDTLYKWLIKLSDSYVSRKPEIGINVVKLLFKLSESRDSPVIFLKYFMMDFVSFCKRDSDEITLTDLDDTLVQQFTLFDKEHAYNYYRYLINEQLKHFNLLEWYIHNSNDFEDMKTINIFYIQLQSLILITRDCLCSIFDIKFIKLALESVTKFYIFMNTFIKQCKERNMKLIERYEFRECIKMITNQLQLTLPKVFTKIQKYMLHEEQQYEEKANAIEISNILQNKFAISNLIKCIELFENELVTINMMHKDVDYMKNYTKFISNIEIQFQSRISRTISEQQINNIINNARVASTH